MFLHLKRRESWSVCPELWLTTGGPRVCIYTPFCVREDEHLYIHRCAAQVCLYMNCFDFIAFTSLDGAPAAVGLSDNPLQSSRRSQVSVTQPTCFDAAGHTLMYCNFLWDEIESSLSSLNTLSTTRLKLMDWISTDNTDPEHNLMQLIFTPGVCCVFILFTF